MIDKNKLDNIPERPGVYLMKDQDGNIIYVGKARNLKNRVRQYFQGKDKASLKVAVMVEHIDDFELIVTDTEMEALILECNLIKKNMPRFNIMLKDDKSYPFIKVTMNEKYPRVIMTRQVKKDGGKYFGPFTNIASVKQTIELINKLYPIKKCNKKFTKEEKPCLYYHIHQCTGICQGKVSKEIYDGYIVEILNILNGRQQEVITYLEKAMIHASKNMEFEKAAQLRDQINGIVHITEKQKVVSSIQDDQDVIGVYIEDHLACIQVFYIRKGKLLGRKHYIFENIDDELDLMTEFIKQLYHLSHFIPKEILLNSHIEDLNIIEQWLEGLREGKVSFKIPQKGDKKKLMDMVVENAKLTLLEYKNKIFIDHEKQQMSYQWLMEQIHLSHKPFRMEAYDISNIKGTDSVGSMVVFENLRANPKAYRRFKIKSIQGQNDYGSMQEIVFRRLERGVKELEIGKGGFLPLPDIIFVDGGTGHVNAIKAIVSLYSQLNIPICGLVKNEHHKLKELVYEGRRIPIPRSTPIYYLLNNISEEVHRFTIEYHKKLRNAKLIHSQLNHISGIGERRRKDLLKHFRSIDNIKKASLDDLLQVNGISDKIAKNILDYFTKNS
ncbi:MAG: excinuclease ABC subunit UvrC [Eubacteriales bacterium]